MPQWFTVAWLLFFKFGNVLHLEKAYLMKYHKVNLMSNSTVQDEMAHFEPSHLDLHCLQMFLGLSSWKLCLILLQFYDANTEFKAPGHSGWLSGYHDDSMSVSSFKDNDEKQVFEEQLNTLQEQLVSVMIENQNLSKKWDAVSSRYLRVKAQPKLLISHSKFSGPRKFTLTYQ